MLSAVFEAESGFCLTSDRPGTVVGRTHGRGVDAPGSYRADHEPRLSPPTGGRHELYLHNPEGLNWTLGQLSSRRRPAPGG